MKSTIKLILTLLVLTIAGCDSALEETPESFLSPAIYNSEANIELAVNGVYDALGNRGFDVGLNFGNYNQGLLLMANMGTDQFRGPDDDAAQRFTLYDLFAWEPTSEVVSHVYTVHYIGINSANSVIANIEPLVGNSDLDDDALNRFLAEARFLRAFYYFNLVRLYGDVPLKLSETASLTGDDVVSIARSPVLAIYEQIEADLLFAQDHLLMPSELNASEHGRANRTAAWAFLARLYNTWATFPLKDNAKWSLAAENARKVIDSGEHLLMTNFQDVFTLENEANDELIFVVKFSSILGENTSNGATNGIIGNGTNGGVPGGTSGFGQLRAEQYYYTTFDADDTRRNWTVSDFRENADLTTTPLTEEQLNDPLSTFFGFAKFRRNGEWLGFNSPYDFPLFRYADVLLMLAEASANDAGGPTAESLDAINQVRARAFGAPNDLPSGLSLDEFNTALLNERSWELGGEDCSRWHDLVRYEILGETLLANKRQAALERFNEDVHILFPIPQTELDANPLATQNPGY